MKYDWFAERGTHVRQFSIIRTQPPDPFPRHPALHRNFYKASMSAFHVRPPRIPAMNHQRPCPSRVLPAVIALAVAFCVVACSTPPRRTEAERTADAAIAAQVEAALLADPNIYARHIDVAVDRGVVRLGGFVWSNEDYLRARHDAASVQGVMAVDTDMDLTRGGVSGTSR